MVCVRETVKQAKGMTDLRGHVFGLERVAAKWSKGTHPPCLERSDRKRAGHSDVRPVLARIAHDMGLLRMGVCPCRHPFEKYKNSHNRSQHK